MFYINDSGFALVPAPLDPKRCNYYIVENTLTVKIETTSEYLARVTLKNRAAGDLVIVLTPKEGYTSGSPYSFSGFQSALTNYWIKYYSFVGGVADENFVEVRMSGQARYSITGDGTEENPFQLVGDEDAPGGPKYYGTNVAGEKGYHSFSGAGGSVSGGAVEGETPSGVIDGVNADFELNYTPESGTVRVYLNGVRLLENTHFTISGSTVTIIDSNIIPVAGDWIAIDYTQAISVSWIYGEQPTGTMNGLNTVFVLSQSASEVYVYLNGVRLLQGTHFTFSGDTITITDSNIIPVSGDWIVVDYKI